MKNTIIVTEKNRGIYGGLLHQQFCKRKQIFVDQLDWKIPSNETLECDQYDRHDTVYVLVEEGGELVAYGRLLPTTSSVQYGRETCSYLVRDAVLGALPGIPPEIYEKDLLPSNETVWEMTRVDAKDPQALFALFEATNCYLVGNGAKETITFSRKSFAKILTRLGYTTSVVGPSIVYGRKEYCVLKTLLNAPAAQ